MTYTLVPYVENNGMMSLTDDFIKAAWNVMKKNRIDKSLFYGGTTKTTQDFMDYIRLPDNVVHFGFIDDTPGSVAWINFINRNYAFWHGAAFPAAWGKHTKQLMYKAFDTWFEFKNKEGEPMFDTLVANIQETNTLALNFVKRIGATIAGTIPNIGYDGHKKQKTNMVITYVERGNYG